MSPLAAARLAVRSLARSPGFTFGVLATFALGIGVNTAVFSAAWGALLAPLPVRDPDSLVNVWQTQPENDRRAMSPANFLDTRREAQSLAGAAAYYQRYQVLTGLGEPRRASVAWVSTTFFDLLGVEARDGRLFRGGESGRQVVVGERLWREELGGAPVAGRVLRLDDASFEIVGVAPAALDLPGDCELWALAEHDVPPIGIAEVDAELTTLRDSRYLGVYARLAPGVSVAQANLEIDAIGKRLEAAYPDANRLNGLRVVSVAEDLGRESRGAFALLAGGALCVLLVACANVAGLLLVRGLGRRREVALRLALGAGPAETVSRALAETLLLAGGGALLGLLVARFAAPPLVAALPGAELAGRPIGLSLAVVTAAALLTLLAAGAAALAPALAALRVPPITALAAARGTLGSGGGRLRAGLVIAQAGAAVLLVAGALLVARTLARLVAVDPGFEAAGVVTMPLSLPTRHDLPAEQRRELLARAAQAAAQAPGVAHAGGILKLPLTGTGFSADARVEGQTFAAGEAPDVSWRAVTPDYFATLGIALRAGRLLAASDDADAPPVALINETLARRLWPAGEAIGRRIATGLDGENLWVEVVGVVADTPQEAVHRPVAPEMYRPMVQESRFGAQSMALAVRTAPGFSPASLRAALRAVSADLVIGPDRPLAALLSASTARERVLGLLLATFGGLALALAGLGLHALLALLVAERTREMGLRMAVGATARDLAALVLRRGALPAAGGAALGLAGALAFGRALRGWLWQVSPADPWSLAGAVAALFAVAALAAWLPARRAARLDPASVLRDE